MALLSELVKVVAKVEGLEEVSVGIFARAARESGLLTQRGRGRGAAHMSATDAANLLIAVNGSTLARQVRQKVSHFRALELVSATPYFSVDPEFYELVGEKEDFGSQLEHLIELARPKTRGICRLLNILESSCHSQDRKYARKKDIVFPEPELRLLFERPVAAVTIELWLPERPVRDRWHPSIPFSELASAEYAQKQDSNESSSGDRTEVITISQKTIVEVARCIYAGSE